MKPVGERRSTPCVRKNERNGGEIRDNGEEVKRKGKEKKKQKQKQRKEKKRNASPLPTTPYFAPSISFVFCGCFFRNACYTGLRALKIVRLSLYPFKNLSLGFILLYFRNVLSTSCTTIPLLESPTRETFSSIQRADAADRILSLTTMNAVVPCPSSQPFTLGGFIIFTVIISSKVIVKTSHEAQSALNSG